MLTEQLKYGWKWENKAPESTPWLGSYANYSKLGDYDLRLQPFNLLYGGYITAGALSNAGALDYYWSFTAYDATDAYDLNFSSDNVYPSRNNWRFYGFSIRCLAR